MHSTRTELAFERKERIVKRPAAPTTIPALREALKSAEGIRIVAIEQGPMADWPWRNLTGDVQEWIVCDPRRNYPISKDKQDRIDRAKSAALLPEGYLRSVHHPDGEERVERSGR